MSKKLQAQGRIREEKEIDISIPEEEEMDDNLNSYEQEEHCGDS